VRPERLPQRRLGVVRAPLLELDHTALRERPDALGCGQRRAREDRLERRVGGGEIVEPVVCLRRAERTLEGLRPAARLERAEPLEREPPLPLARERGAGPEERLPDVR
jgi:hypothetical protein